MKYLLLSVLIIFTIGLFTIPDVFADKTYTNDKYDFSLQYPANWKVSELYLVDEASNSEIIVELTSPEYEAWGCINDECGKFWYANDRILITRDVVAHYPVVTTSSVKAGADSMFDAFSLLCKQMTYQSNGQICREPVLIFADVHTIGTHSKIDTVKIVASSTNLFEQGVMYYPFYITIAWHDPVDKRNWQINVVGSDFKFKVS